MMERDISRDQEKAASSAGLKRKAAASGPDSESMQFFRCLRSANTSIDTNTDVKMSEPPGVREAMAAAHPQLVNGTTKLTAEELSRYTKDNLSSWNAMAEHWEVFQSPADASGKAEDGNDMFTQCLLPVVDELAEWKTGQTVLDLGAGSGIIARRFGNLGAHVIGLDYSEPMLEQGRKRRETEKLKGSVTYDFIDLMDFDGMVKYMEKRDNVKFDIITISTTLKSLPDLEPVAKALPLMLAPGGRVVIVDLHPVFSKPAGHRGMEIYENPATGKQQLDTYIKVPKYLNIPPTLSEAVRGQPEPLWVFHRPFHSLLAPFFNNDLVLDAMREPAFKGDPVPAQAQSYHNFQQTPMLLAFRLRHKA